MTILVLGLSDVKGEIEDRPRNCPALDITPCNAGEDENEDGGSDQVA